MVLCRMRVSERAPFLGHHLSARPVHLTLWTLALTHPQLLAPPAQLLIADPLQKQSPSGQARSKVCGLTSRSTLARNMLSFQSSILAVAVINKQQLRWGSHTLALAISTVTLTLPLSTTQLLHSKTERIADGRAASV